MTLPPPGTYFEVHGVVDGHQNITMRKCSMQSADILHVDGRIMRRYVINSDLTLSGETKFNTVLDYVTQIQWHLSDCRQVFGIYDVDPADEPEHLFSCNTSYGHFAILHGRHPEFHLRVSSGALLSEMIFRMRAISRFFGFVFGKRMSIWDSQIMSLDKDGGTHRHAILAPFTKQDDCFIAECDVLVHPRLHRKQIVDMIVMWTDTSSPWCRYAGKHRNQILKNWGSEKYPEGRLVQAVSAIDSTMTPSLCEQHGRYSRKVHLHDKIEAKVE